MLRIISPRVKYMRLLIADFSSQKQHPYILGGLPSSKIWASDKAQQFVHSLASQDVNKTFIQIYKRYLQALQDKDIEFLNKKVQKNLSNNIISSKLDLILINKQAPVQIHFEKSFLISNIGFNREQHEEEMSLDRNGETLQMFEGYNKTIKQQSQSSVTILFGVRAYLKSSMKLVKKDKKGGQDKRQQSHLVQFQLQSQRSRGKIFFRNTLSKLINFRNKKQQRLSIQRYIIGASPISDWKIADFDRNLNGNLPKVNTNPQFKINQRNKHRQKEQD